MRPKMCKNTQRVYLNCLCVHWDDELEHKNMISFILAAVFHLEGCIITIQFSFTSMAASWGRIKTTLFHYIMLVRSSEYNNINGII